MLRKMLVMVTLMLAMPVVAHAWTVSISVTGPAAGMGSGPGKNNVYISNPVTTVTGGTAYAYPAATVDPVVATINRAPGYDATVTLNGAPVTPAPGTNIVNIPKSVSIATLKVTYIVQSISIPVTQAAGGVVSISIGNATSTTGFSNVATGSPVTVTATPNSGYLVNSIKVNNVSVPGTAGPNNTTAYTFSATASVPVTAVFDIVPYINATLTAPVTAVTDSAVSMTVSATTNAGDSTLQYQFSADDGAGHIFNQAASASKTFNFTPTAAGTYTISSTISSGSVIVNKSAVVTVISAVGSSNGSCIGCHSSSTPQIVSLYNTSRHYNKLACQDCHTPTPHVVALPTSSVCSVCHFGSVGSADRHPVAISADCITCHNPHSTVGTSTDMPATHYNNITSGMYPASYMTSRATCQDCHYADSSNQTIRKQWAASGHAATSALPWIDYDFKTRAGCVQCHTTTGFIAFSTAKVTAAWGVATDKTKEVLTCIGCHSDMTTGAVRTVTPVKPFADETGFTNRNLGSSNICMDCHSGRNNGASIAVKVGSGDFNTLAFIAPHYLSAGGTLQSKSGYHFPGRTYASYSSNSHHRIGMANTLSTGTSGPCAACHMTSASKHLFTPASVDQAGTITAVTTTICTNCHGAVLPAATLEADRAAFNNGLDILKAQLAAIGHVYSPDYPYFTAGSWGTGQAGANVMGAAFNYKLLLAEPGAYAHNPAYAKQLITDSIDAAYHGGTVTGDISDALAALVASNAVSQDAANSLSSYAAATPCASCHTNTSGAHTRHLNSSIGCADCHSLTAASNTALISGTVKHLNGVRDVNLSAGGSFGAGTCSTVYCHSNGAGTFTSPNWTTGISNCFYCHPLAQLRGAHAAHVGSLIPTVYGDTANNSTAAEYRFGCGSCHPTAVSSHMDGHIDVTLVPTAGGSLRSKNDPNVLVGGIGNTGSGITGASGSSVVCSAAYCHSNGGVGAALAYVASPDWYGGAYAGDKCAMCHSNAPATGAHAKHLVSVHSGHISDANGNLIPAAAPAGIVAGHGDPSQSTTIGCTTCHNTTVTASANDNGTACAACHVTDPKGTPTIDRTKHLNGSVDVVFKDVKIVTKAQIRPSSFGSYSAVWTRTGSAYKVDAGSFDTAKLSLNQATFGGDKSCANVACHNGGTPKWSDRLTCVSCHSQL